MATIAVKKPELFSSNFFRIFAPKTLIFKQAEYTKYDIAIVIDLPDNINAQYCSLDKNFKKLEQEKTRIYLGLPNFSFKDELLIKKTTHLGSYYLINKIKLLSNMSHQIKRRCSTRTKTHYYRRRQMQTGVFLNR